MSPSAIGWAGPSQGEACSIWVAKEEDLAQLPERAREPSWKKKQQLVWEGGNPSLFFRARLGDEGVKPVQIM